MIGLRLLLTGFVLWFVASALDRDHDAPTPVIVIGLAGAALVVAGALVCIWATPWL